ncbi:MAG: tetratricopeptide repeat protein [Candidatus Omnitrophica bacterium]|nr:tetratricopeptide repeat protein [Candidatus Omnitrophota bacterium]
MEKYDNCSCSNSYNHDKRPRLVLRCSLSFAFVALSFIVMRPFIVKQLVFRASSYMACELFNDAIRSYEKAVFIDKKNVKAWDMLGYAYKSNGNLEKSIYAYHQAIKADPKDKSANFSLGVILASESKCKEAVAYFERIIAFGPDENGQTIDIVSYHKSSLRLLAECYEALNEFDKNDKVLKELQKYYPQDSSMAKKANLRRFIK